MTKQPLEPNTKLDIEHILEGLEDYHPPRKGWTWRDVPAEGVDMGPFHFRDMSKPLKKSIGLPAAKYFDNIDPQPMNLRNLQRLSYQQIAIHSMELLNHYIYLLHQSYQQ